jgi:hypothetical protein
MTENMNDQPNLGEYVKTKSGQLVENLGYDSKTQTVNVEFPDGKSKTLGIHEVSRLTPEEEFKREQRANL